MWNKISAWILEYIIFQCMHLVNYKTEIWNEYLVLIIFPWNVSHIFYKSLVYLFVQQISHCNNKQTLLYTTLFKFVFVCLFIYTWVSYNDVTPQTDKKGQITFTEYKLAIFVFPLINKKYNKRNKNWCISNLFARCIFRFMYFLLILSLMIWLFLELK